MKTKLANVEILLLLIVAVLFLPRCRTEKTVNLKPKISLVNSPTDIVSVGAKHLAKLITQTSNNEIIPKVYAFGVLSGGKGKAEIEMCQQGSIEIHITTTAYLASIVPKTSIFSLPFLFDNLEQVVGIVKSKSAVLDTINSELERKRLRVIAWWPRGFRQLTNSKRPIKSLDDIKGLVFRVMNNPLYVDNLNAMGANPVPMAWGEVYNALQLNTIDGQENAEDVVFNSKLYEAQKYLTVWDYSTDIEVVMVNTKWWSRLSDKQREMIQDAANKSVDFQVDLLRKTTETLREKLLEKGMEIYYLPQNEKQKFRETVIPVWEKYKPVFTESFFNEFIREVQKY
jgi:tripartite ATP-independent transporter DctP family solute receptor